MATTATPTRVFLTGGTGFIGRALTRSLRARGWKVDALVRSPDTPQAREIAALGATLVPGDVTSAESMRGAMRGADIVVHNAGLYEYGVTGAARVRMRSVNVDATAHVLSLARELSIPRTIHVSSEVALGDTGGSRRDETHRRVIPPSTCYEETKAEAHALALGFRAGGLPLIIVMPGAVVGPNDHSGFGYFLRLYLNGWMPPAAWAPNAVATPVYVDDLAEGIALAAERGRIGEDYLLGGEAQTMRQVLAHWDRWPGGSRRRVWMPASIASPLFAPAAPLLRAMRLPAFISAETVRAAAIDYDYSSAKARRELGWTPRGPAKTWDDTIAGEQALAARRTSRSLSGRLRPL